MVLELWLWSRGDLLVVVLVGVSVSGVAGGCVRLLRSSSWLILLVGAVLLVS